MRMLTLSVAAAAAISALGVASQDATANSPFCFAGSPTPKHVCDALKAAEQKKPVHRTKHETAKNAIGNIR